MKPFKIFAETVDPKAMGQFMEAMKHPSVVRGALMPDVHVGYSLPIGSVVETKGFIFPSWVGYDIGCGVAGLKTTFSPRDVTNHAEEIQAAILKSVPVGMRHNEKDSIWYSAPSLMSDELRKMYTVSGTKQLGTLGGGNHFIEIGINKKDRVWIIVHSGSRGIGHDIAHHYMKLASGGEKAREGNFPLEEKTEPGEMYIKDLEFCLAFALQNRVEILSRAVNAIKEIIPGDAIWLRLINRNHNHAERKNGLWIHRKGATHADRGMLGIIPGNMKDGSFIVSGLGNSDSLCSCSHGAGRVLGRADAKRTLSMDEFREKMVGVTAIVTEGTLDESPMAYKDIFSVMEQQKDLVKVIDHVTPIINIKDGTNREKRK